MMMNKIFVAVLIIFSLPSLEAPSGDKEKIRKAVAFMTKADKELNSLATEASRAYWNWKVNITDHNLKIKENASRIASEYSRKVYLDSQKHEWKSFRTKNSTLYRWFKLAATGRGSINPSGLFAGGDTNPYSKMSEIFGKAKVCPPDKKEEKCTIDALKEFPGSKDPKLLKHYWLEFRKNTGDKYKDLFLEAIKMDNEEATEFGYKNKAIFNVALYEDKNFIKTIAEEIRKILPFYRQIHAYVRKKLKQHYKSENIKSDGPIPAHLLGDMYAQKWNNIFEIVEPYPSSSGFPNVTKAMKGKNMEDVDMFLMAEKFFTSLGFPGMTPHFWHKSMIRKPVGREVDCHPSAHNFYDRKDYRIKMCTEVNTNYLGIVHHEMGHIEYYMLYKNLPFLLRDAANPGFHEAIGDAISLSVMTPSYLEQVDLLEKNQIKKDKKFTINYLMEMALQYVVTAPYAYIIDLWRNRVYMKTIEDNELNRMYWQFRMQYQGVCPPSKRSEENFDIGAKYHIASGVEYWRYFVANILQFQIHKVLCKLASHEGPLHECNIYKNKNAGKSLARFMKKGRSQNWKALFHKFSKSAFRKLDASAMLEYFKPLIDWLKKTNSDEYIGWKTYDPMSCPGDEESVSTNVTGTSVSGGTANTKSTKVSGGTTNTQSAKVSGGTAYTQSATVSGGTTNTLPTTVPGGTATTQSTISG